MAIQLVINREWGVAKNENPNQGAFIIEELTDLVEEAVLKEFEAIASAAACSAPWKPATSAARSRKSR
jgi:methylmalonyl-CoA mutase N-terminal domain/subunit